MTQTTAKTAVNQTPPTTNTLAVMAIIFGVISLPLSLFLMGGLLGIPAVIFGSIALKKQQPGTGLSIAGIITGTASTCISLVLLAVFVVCILLGYYPFEVGDMPLPGQESAQNPFESGSI